VVVYLPPERSDAFELAPALGSSDSATRPHGGTLREYGLGAQVLGALGIQKIRLLTNNPKRIAALNGHGLDLVECVPLGGG
jgi:GTP cyclohydrolase II